VQTSRETYNSSIASRAASCHDTSDGACPAAVAHTAGTNAEQMSQLPSQLADHNITRKAPRRAPTVARMHAHMPCDRAMASRRCPSETHAQVGKQLFPRPSKLSSKLPGPHRHARVFVYRGPTRRGRNGKAGLRRDRCEGSHCSQHSASPTLRGTRSTKTEPKRWTSRFPGWARGGGRRGRWVMVCARHPNEGHFGSTCR
jgi:hypothetical protein